MNEKMKKNEEKETNIAKQTGKCNDKKCPLHGEISARGRIFGGKVITKHPKRIAIELQRVIFIPKYERYIYKKTKIHAHLPDCMADNVQIGDIVKIQECRPLGKIIHSVVVEKVK